LENVLGKFLKFGPLCPGILRYRCTLCPRVYTTRRGLRTHLKYHSTDRPHTCPTCKASFKVRSKLADHIKLVHVQKVLFNALISFVVGPTVMLWA